MHENDLQLLNWLSLSEEARRANFGQVLRYFVSPLIPIEAIQSETATIGTQVFQTYSARLAGQQFIFIPCTFKPFILINTHQIKTAPPQCLA